MIDIENDVFSYVANAIRTSFPDAYVVGEFIDVPAKFPAVTIVEADNRVFERMRTLNIENAVRVMYECNVYSNKASGKKVQAKEIATVMDEAFTSIGFTRTFREQVPNLNSATIYRIVCRYEAVVGDNFMIYQN